MNLPTSIWKSFCATGRKSILGTFWQLTTIRMFTAVAANVYPVVGPFVGTIPVFDCQSGFLASWGMCKRQHICERFLTNLVIIYINNSMTVTNHMIMMIKRTSKKFINYCPRTVTIMDLIHTLSTIVQGPYLSIKFY